MKKVLELSLDGKSDSSPSPNKNMTPAIPAHHLCCIPDYLLDATSEYREGKQYFEASLLDEAQSKFTNAINLIACNDPAYMQENDFFSPLTSAIVKFMNMKCEQSMEKEATKCSSSSEFWFNFAATASNLGQLFKEQPDNDDIEGRSSLAVFQSRKHQSIRTKKEKDAEDSNSVDQIVNALKNEEQPLPNTFERCGDSGKRVYLPNDVLQRVICVMLTEIVTALALVHQMREEDQEFEELFRASNRLHTILYGQDSLKCILSSGHLDRLCSQHSAQKLGGEFAIQENLPRVFIYQSNPSVDFDIGLCDILE